MTLMHRHFLQSAAVAVAAFVLSAPPADAFSWGKRTVVSGRDRTIVNVQPDRSHWRKRYYHHTENGETVFVDVPADYVETGRRRVWVDAPPASVRINRRGVWVRAPYVDVYVPR